MVGATRTLRIESLEQKQMLAGDVLVDVVNGVLTLRGDDLANQVVVNSGEQPGSYVIHGLDGTRVLLADETPDDTVENSTLVVEGVRRGVIVNLGAGDDLLRVHDAVFRSNVAINMGAGNDRVAIGVLPPATETETTLVDDETGEDVPSVRLSQNLLIRTGEGNDTVVIDDTVGRGSVAVLTGEGDDTVRLGLVEETDDEEATVDVNVSFGRGVAVDLGAGADSLIVNHLRAGGFHANGGAGADTMRIAGIHSLAIHVSGGVGEDSDDVAITDAVTRLLAVSLGGGDDKLSLGGVKAQLALLQGGRGEADTLTLLGENMIRHRRVAGFEIINPSEVATA
jgi:hypothetical protein